MRQSSSVNGAHSSLPICDEMHYRHGDAIYQQSGGITSPVCRLHKQGAFAMEYINVHHVEIILCRYAPGHTALWTPKYNARQHSKRTERPPQDEEKPPPACLSGSYGCLNARKAADITQWRGIGCFSIHSHSPLRCRGPPSPIWIYQNSVEGERTYAKKQR